LEEWAMRQTHFLLDFEHDTDFVKFLLQRQDERRLEMFGLAA
jgi:hypothetical protein